MNTLKLAKAILFTIGIIIVPVLLLCAYLQLTIVCLSVTLTIASICGVRVMYDEID